MSDTATETESTPLPLDDQEPKRIVHSVCTNCYGLEIPFGTVVTTLCGKQEPFDNWAKPGTPLTCSECAKFFWCLNH